MQQNLAQYAKFTELVTKNHTESIAEQEAALTIHADATAANFEDLTAEQQKIVDENKPLKKAMEEIRLG